MNIRNLKSISGLALLALVAVPCSAASETFAIVNAKVHTLGEKGSIESGTVVIDGGRISAVGASVRVPAGATVIDAEGMVVTPGIFEPLSYLGLVEVGQVEQTNDNALVESYGPAFSVADAFNARSTLIPTNRIEGVTRALITPRAKDGGQLIAGQAAVVHLGSRGANVIERKAGVVVFLGDRGSALAGGSRAAALTRLRESLEDARDLAQNREGFDEGRRRDYALSRPDLEALADVADGRLPLIAHAQRVSDIEALLAFARDENIRLVIAGAAEGWMIADRIAAAKIPVIVDPMVNLPRSFETLNARLDNAARLHEAGVLIAFAEGNSHNARNLTQAAGNAVSYGLPWEHGLRAITVNPAAIFGQSGMCCTLEAGKEADVVIWDGDPLEVTTFATQVFIRGEQIPMHSRQTLLRDRYLELDGEWPPAYRKP